MRLGARNDGTPFLTWLMPCRVTKNGRSAWCFLHTRADVHTFVELFIEEEYMNSMPDAPDVIFDAGSNIGLSVIFFKLQYPDAQIYAFEPNPAVWDTLIQNTQQFGSSVVVYQCALGGASGQRTLFVDDAFSPSASLEERDDTHRSETVSVATVGQMHTHLGIGTIDLLKLDVEGLEYDILRSVHNSAVIRRIIGEVHADLLPVSMTAFEKELQRFGTPQLFALNNQRALFSVTPDS